jgi:hypothetical protein
VEWYQKLCLTSSLCSELRESGARQAYGPASWLAPRVSLRIVAKSVPKTGYQRRKGDTTA